MSQNTVTHADGETPPSPPHRSHSRRSTNNAHDGGRGDVARAERQRAGAGPVAVPAAGAVEGAGGSRQGEEHRRAFKVYYSVSGRHLRNTILRFEHLRRFEPHCLFFGATERELAARARAEGAAGSCTIVPNFFFELDRIIPEHATVDTFITTVSPMDADGNFSLGTNSDYSVVMSRRCQRIVVEVNRTHAARARSGADSRVRGGGDRRERHAARSVSGGAAEGAGSTSSRATSSI